jgi:hypothetical protein
MHIAPVKDEFGRTRAFKFVGTKNAHLAKYMSIREVEKESGKSYDRFVNTMNSIGKVYLTTTGEAVL